jgi:YVTN family beta-propeller protein
LESKLFDNQLRNGLKKVISVRFYYISILSSLSIFFSILIMTLCSTHSYLHEQAAAMLHTNTAVKLSKENTENPVFPELTNYLTYQNPTLGAKIRYPIDWIKNETTINQIVATFDSPQIDSTGHYTAEVKLGIDTSSRTINLNEYLIKEKENYVDNKNFTNFHVINDTVNSYIAGQPAYSFVCMYTSSSSHINYVAIKTGTMVNNSKVDWIFVLIEADHYSYYLPIVQKMINSFKFIDQAQATQQALSYHDIFQNGTNQVHFPINTWTYPFQVPAGVVNVSLNATFRSLNGHAINATLLDAAKCGHHSQSGKVDDIRTCSQFLVRKTMPAGSLVQRFLIPGKLYNIILEDNMSPSNRLKTYFVLDFQRDFLNYANYTPYGIRMLYPYNWEIAEENGGVRFLAPFKNNTLPYQDNIFIKSYPLPYEGINLNKLTESDINAYKQVTKNFKLFDSNKIGLNNNASACRLVFTYTDGKYTFNATQILMIKNNKIYRITYTVILPQTYLNYLPTLQVMIDSFRPLFLLPYKNFVIGINNLFYPSDWQTSETQDQISFKPPVEAVNNNTDSVLQLHRVPILGRVLEDFVGDDINYYKQDVTGFDLAELRLTKVDGHRAYEIEYTFKDANLQKQYKEIQFYTIVGNRGYIISYIEELSRYYNYLDAMEHMLTSLKIQNVNDGIEIDKPGIGMNNRPNDISINPSTHVMYVTNGASDTVSVINTKTNRILNNITVGATPNDVNIDTKQRILYVANIGSNTVSVIDTLTNKIISNTIVGRTPAAISEDPDDGFLFTANRDSDTVSVIDTENYQLLRNIVVGSSPLGIAVNTITHTLYVVNSGSNTISIINYYSEITGHSFRLSKPIKTIYVGETPDGIAIDAVTNRIYVSNGYANTISVIDGETNSVVKTILVGTAPMRLAVNSITNMIYVVNNQADIVSVIDGETNSVVKTILVGYYPYGIAVDPDTNRIYVTNSLQNEMYVINGVTNSVTAGISFEINSGSIYCQPGGRISKNSYIIYDLYSIVKCEANPNSGFVLSSWTGDLPYNINKTKPSVIQFNVTRYGTLTPNFGKTFSATPINVSVPTDLLYGVILGPTVGSVLAWLIPYFIDRNDKKMQLQTLRTETAKIDKIYNLHEKSREERLALLNDKRIEIMRLLEKGMMNYTTYQILDGRINKYIDTAKAER